MTSNKIKSRELFIVSNARELWKKEILNAFVVEPYVYHKIEIDKGDFRFSSIKLAARRRATKEDLETDNNFVNTKYTFYIHVLARRLNEIHKTDYSEKFWEKSIGLGLLRYITAAHDAFMNFELSFDPDLHDCNILSRESFFIPNDFEELRSLLQYSDFGQEQLFSMYISLFYKNTMTSKRTLFPVTVRASSNSKFWIKRKNGLNSIIKRIKQITLKKIISKIYLHFKNGARVKVGIYGAYFASASVLELQSKSKGVINQIPNFVPTYGSKMDENSRAQLAKSGFGFDRFDQYFFSTMNSLLPRYVLEDFQQINNDIKIHFKQYVNLKYIVGESWIGNSVTSMAIANLQYNNNIRHVYNEHNALFYPFVGSMVEYRASLSDVYYSMGWNNVEINNFSKGASLFKFQLEKSRRIKFEITLISNNRFAKIPEYSSFYGFCGENVEKFTAYMREFYSSLSLETKKTILYRGARPGFNAETIYDNDYLLTPYLSELYHQDTSALSGKKIMASSGLVILDYFATSFLESLHMNVPTILLMSDEIYYLKPQFAGFFDELVAVGICHNNASKAAAFIENIKSDINKWWFSVETQNARIAFIDKNFGNRNEAIRYYLSLIK